MTNNPPPDVRALLGMHTPGARVLVAVYLVLLAIVTVSCLGGASSAWPSLLALVVLGAATVALVPVPGDPLPTSAAVAMAAAGPVACGLTLAAIPGPFANPLQEWTHGGATTVFCFMCVRGRIGLAWAGLAATGAMYGIWAEATGQGFLSGLLRPLIDIGPLGIATVLAIVLRPAAALVFALRAESTRRVAAESAAAAALEERSEQLLRLDALARGLLERIGSGAALSESERVECALLEARLRDRLRAPEFDEPSVSDPVDAARRRGVQIDLIDDHGMADASDGARNRLRTAVTAAVRDAAGGAVRVRILPPGRAHAASILVRDETGVQRTEYDADGYACR